MLFMIMKDFYLFKNMACVRNKNAVKTKRYLLLTWDMRFIYESGSRSKQISIHVPTQVQISVKFGVGDNSAGARTALSACRLDHIDLLPHSFWHDPPSFQ